VLEAEGSGETVGEARWAALRELERLAPNLDRERVEIVVVSEGERGLLGVGREPARVLARAPMPEEVPPPESAPPTQPSLPSLRLSDEAERARAIVERIAAAVADGFEVHVEEDDERIVATVAGPSAGLVIGRHGHTIDAIQHLVSAILYPAPGERREIVVDAQGYRDRRERVLRDLARRAADDAVREGCAMELDPMSSAERKIVHLALAERGDVVTASEGREPSRFVVISPRDAG
jgi:spoIIIJ-associated protein